RRARRGRRRVRRLPARRRAFLEPELMARRRGHHTHYGRVPTISFAALILAVAGLTTMLWSAERGADARLNVKNPGDLNALLPSIVGLTESSMDAGNRVRVLQNGDQLFPALLADIAAARGPIHIASYIWWQRAVCDPVARALA